MALSTIRVGNLDYKLSYEICHPKAKYSLLILHGWGANKELMKQAFKENLSTFKQIYLDLPGFGNSNIIKPLNSKDYALIVREFLAQNEFKIDLFMGHSFGGKLCSLLAKENQKAVLILLSSAGIVWKKSLKIRSKIAVFKLFKNLGLQKFRHFFIAQDAQGLNELMYESFKKVVDEDFSDEFASLQNQSLIFWGEEDTATPLKSGEKIHSLIKNSKFYPLKGDHFFFLKQAKEISKIVLENLGGLK